MVDTGFPVVWCMSDTRNDATYDNDSPVVDGRVRRHLLSGAQHGVFDSNMAMMDALESGEPIGRLARRYRVSRQWVSALRRRYAAEGEAGLLPCSRRPTRSTTTPGRGDQPAGRLGLVWLWIVSVFWSRAAVRPRPRPHTAGAGPTPIGGSPGSVAPAVRSARPTPTRPSSPYCCRTRRAARPTAGAGAPCHRRRASRCHTLRHFVYHSCTTQQETPCQPCADNK